MNESIILITVLGFLRGALMGVLTALVMLLFAFVLNWSMEIIRILVEKIEELRKDK